MLEFRIGERAWCESGDGERVEGIIVRYNSKSASLVADDDCQWRVGPLLLRKVAGDVIDSTAE